MTVFFLGDPKIRWKAPLPSVPFALGAAGGRLMRAWRVNMNSSFSVAILLVREEDKMMVQFKFLLYFGFSCEGFEGSCDAVKTIVKGT